MKKLCIIYANCQNTLIAKFLAKSASFNQEYSIQRFAAHLLIKEKKTIPEALLKKAKLFIYQPVQEKHGIASSKYILEKLSPDCQTISFPSLYFTGYFPQFCKNTALRVIPSLYPHGIIPYGDANIISMLEESRSTQYIIEKLSSADFYSREALLENVERSLNELVEREKAYNIDILVSKFIRNNYQRHHLFYTNNHPTNILGIFVVNHILKKIGFPLLKDDLFTISTKHGVLSQCQIPIYPSVIKHLELDFVSQASVYKYTSFCTNQMQFARHIKEYIEFHLLTPGGAADNYLQGLEAAKNQNTNQAEYFFKQAIVKNPKNATYYRELGNNYLTQNKLPEAEIVFKKAIEVSPDWIGFYKSLGKIFTAQKKYVDAARTYKQAIKLAPNNQELYALLGDTLSSLKYLDVAEKCYLNAIRLNPRKARYYRCLGDISRQQNHLDRAIAHYEQAIALSPQNPWLYINLSEVLIEQNKLEEAKQKCQESLSFKRAKRVGFYRRVGNLQVKIGSFDEAISTYRQAIKLNPTLPKPKVRQIRSQIQEAMKAKDFSLTDS